MCSEYTIAALVSAAADDAVAVVDPENEAPRPMYPDLDDVQITAATFAQSDEGYGPAGY